MIPLCVDEGVGIIPWSPLARGFLTHKFDNKETKEKTVREKTEEDRVADWFDENSLAIRETVHKIAAERKVSPAEVAVAWLLTKDAVTSPIVGVSKIEHLDGNLRALNLKLTEAEIKALEAHYKPKKLIGWLR